MLKTAMIIKFLIPNIQPKPSAIRLSPSTKILYFAIKYHDLARISKIKNPPIPPIIACRIVISPILNKA